MLIVRQAEGKAPVVTVVPITHSPHRNPDAAIEIPSAIKRHLGLDDQPSWIVLDDLNVFTWPGYDLLLRTGFHGALRRVHQVRFHDLRSFASNLLAEGVDVVTVSKALGHANVHITLVTYAHAIPKARQGAGDALAGLMVQTGNKMETLASKTEIE